MTTELEIGGMTCASCVSHVTRALKRVPGVEDAQVNLASERASVTHEANVQPLSLITAVEKAGYGAAVARGEALDDADAARRDREIVQRGRLLALAIALSVPVVVLGMAVPAFAYKDWLMGALTLPVWSIVGWTFHRGAIKSALHGTTTMDTLVSLGSTAAFAYSIYATISGLPTYYETAAAIVTLIFLGKYLETRARGASNGAIRALMRLRPTTARVRSADGSVRDVAIDDVRIGDVLIVPAGERIPVDGIVIEGRSAVDVSMLTGEPLPREVEPNDGVQAGTINGDGTLILRAAAVGAGTVLARIVEIVRAAQGSTPPVQRLADRIAGIFVPVILVIAAITFAAWTLTGHSAVRALIDAVAVLVVACPCALGLATPMAVMVGVGVGAQRGVLFKDAVALEQLGTATAAVFDKTGTLTIGRPDVARIDAAEGFDDDALLAAAAAVERGSSHPIATAIVRAAQERGITAGTAREIVTERGAGVRGTFDGKHVLVGTPAYLAREGITMNGNATIAVAIDGALAGTIAIADAVRPTSAQAIAELQTLGLRTYLVSGDAAAPVAALAAAIGIDAASIVAQASPERKASFISELREHGARVAFVGDGINDAPALARADVGIAMGGGTEIALETAQAAIISNDPRALASAVRLSRATMRTIKQNLFWAFAYNVVLVPLAALGVVQPLYAAAAMGLSSLFVVGNSLLLRRR
jgi:Cu+-exporting ATPase